MCDEAARFIAENGAVDAGKLEEILSRPGL
jgi:hypothetical protein